MITHEKVLTALGLIGVANPVGARADGLQYRADTLGVSRTLFRTATVASLTGLRAAFARLDSEMRSAVAAAEGGELALHTRGGYARAFVDLAKDCEASLCLDNRGDTEAIVALANEVCTRADQELDAYQAARSAGGRPPTA